MKRKASELSQRKRGEHAFRAPNAARDPKAGQPQLVGDLLSGFLSSKGISAKVEAATAITNWDELVGPQIAAVTTAQRISEGTLFVGVANSAWMMELDLMKGELLRRINAGRGEGRIRQIVFVMAG